MKKEKMIQGTYHRRCCGLSQNTRLILVHRFSLAAASMAAAVESSAEKAGVEEFIGENRENPAEEDSPPAVTAFGMPPPPPPLPPFGRGGETRLTRTDEDEDESERLKNQQKMNAAVATAERRSNERPGVMKRARWGATHRIHEHFVDGFPELEERFVREREAAERRFEYNLGSRNFASKREGEEGIDTLKVLFRKLDRAIGIRDANMVQSIREEFLAELRHWNWRKGARVEFKRRKTAQTNNVVSKSHLSDDEDDDAYPRRRQSAPARPPIDSLAHLHPPPPQHFIHNDSKNAFSPHQQPQPTVLEGGNLSSCKAEGEDDSSVDDLDADDINAIDDRFRRVSPDASVAVKKIADSSPRGEGGGGGRSEKVQVAEARRHLLAESVAIALVTLKWKSMQPHDIELMRKQADENQRQQQMLGMLDA